MTSKKPTFGQSVIRWQRDYGRHDLPWQNTRDAYRIWLSEIMLQQTQVTTVLAYYERFLARFPDVVSLANAPLDDVLALWSGLGYYSRARNLHAAARQVMEQHGGVFPVDVEALEQLPGVGRSTAGAIAVFAAGARAAILDGNVKRVLSRYHGVMRGKSDTEWTASLWSYAESALPSRDVERYTQGLMDLGATVCTARSPTCLLCPLSADCVARASGEPERWPGSPPPRAIPERETTMIVITHGERIALVKRPPKGVWGGLYCFPESAKPVTLKSRLREWGIGQHSIEAGPSLTHTFTHFRLHISTKIVRSVDPVARQRGAELAWFTRTEALAAGIPVPVRKVIEQISEV